MTRPLVPRCWRGRAVVSVLVLAILRSVPSSAQAPLPLEPAHLPEATPAGLAAPCDPGNAAGSEEKPFWSKVPPVQPFPRPGMFVIFPDGPGYYSLRDVLEGNYREKPPKGPYPRTSITFGSFYDADYRYLEDPNYTGHDFFDPIKRIHLGNNWLLSLGGEERLRYMNDVNKRLTGKDTDYLLDRSRLYADLWYRDVFRVCAEYRDALYNKQGMVLRRDPTGQAGYHVGNEIDFYSNVHLSQHQDLLFGYSHLFPGEFIERTGFGGGVDFCFVQYSFKF